MTGAAPLMGVAYAAGLRSRHSASNAQDRKVATEHKPCRALPFQCRRDRGVARHRSPWRKCKRCRGTGGLPGRVPSNPRRAISRVYGPCCVGRRAPGAVCTPCAVADVPPVSALPHAPVWQSPAHIILDCFIRPSPCVFGFWASARCDLSLQGHWRSCTRQDTGFARQSLRPVPGGH